MSETKERPLDASEIEVNKTTAEKNKAERELFAAQARRALAEAEVAEIIKRTKERDEANELAKDNHNHVYVFDKSVTEASVKDCIQTLTRWSRQDPKCEIELQINSPGGSIMDGFALIDFIRDLQAKGHVVNTVALGMAASMGGVLLQVGNTRAMGKNAVFLLHEGSLGAIGNYAEVADKIELMKILHARILDIFENRALSINSKTTAAFLKKQWTRTDLWLDSGKCKEWGLVDEVR